MKKRSPHHRTKASVRQPSSHDRFLAALRVVVRKLGGNRTVLLASGYRPAEKRGFWVSPHNPHIMWKERDAVLDLFTPYRWSDRAKAANVASP